MPGPFGLLSQSYFTSVRHFFLSSSDPSWPWHSFICCCYLVAKLCLTATPWTAACSPPLPFTSSRSLSKLMSVESVTPSSAISSLAASFSCLQSFPASGSFPVSQFFTSGGQSTGASASASVLPMNIQDWFPLGWTGLISLQSKGLSRVVFSTTVQKHQFFSAQASLSSNSHIWTWLLEKPVLRDPTLNTFSFPKALASSLWINDTNYIPDHPVF